MESFMKNRMVLFLSTVLLGMTFQVIVAPAKSVAANEPTGSFYLGNTYSQSLSSPLVVDPVTHNYNKSVSFLLPAGTAPGTGDFTYELWIKNMQTSASNPLHISTDIIGTRGAGGGGSGFDFFYDYTDAWYGPTGNREPRITVYQGAPVYDVSASPSPSKNQWNHVVFERSSGVGKIFLNGQLVTSQTDTRNFDSLLVTLGEKWPTNNEGGFQGYMSNFRYVKGLAVYSGNFSVPTSPLQATQAAGANIAAIPTLSGGIGTQVLLNTLNSADFLKDSSSNNLSISNNVVRGSGAVASSESPFAIPSVSSVNVSSGSVSGGTSATITGTNLTSATGVTVGGSAATSVVVNSATSISFSTPSGTVGTKDVVVQTPLGYFTLTSSFTYTLPPQTISFTEPANIIFGNSPATLSAVSTSGLTVSFTSTTTGVCTVSGTTITILTTGSCSITASQAGNGSYSAATDVVKSFSVYSGSLSGTATFGQVLTANATAFTPSSYQWKRSATSGGIYTDIASATSSTYTLTGADVGNFVKVSMTSSDALVVTTSPTSSVGALSQTITFGALTGAKLTASPVTLSGAALATASSGLTPTYSSSTIETCTATSAGVITLKLVGTCTIVASQAGNSGYGAATPVSQNLIISADVPAAPFINSVSTGGDTTGTASVKFTPGASNGATIDSFTVTATNGGTTLTQMVLSGTGDSATVTGLTLGLPYTIAVKAYNSAGASLATTYGSTVTTASAPYAVTNLRTTQSAAGSLRVNFTPPASLNGGTALTYKYFIVPSGGTFSGTENYATAPASGSTITADPGYVFTGLTPSTAYDIKVVASTTGAGSSLESFTAVVSQIPAGVPTAPRLTLTQTDSQTVLVQWFAQSDNGSALVSPYFTKTVTVDGSAATCTGSSSTAAGGSCSVTSLVGGQVVSASVYGTNIIGNSSTTTSNSSGVIGTVSAPTSLVATAGNAQISIAFNQVTNGDSVIYFRYSTNGVDYVVNSATTSPVVVTGLTNGTSYTIYLQAVGASNGAGPASASVVSTPIAPATGPAPLVLGPPPSTFVVVANPKISRSGTSFVCTSGTYNFKKQGGKEEASSITSQLISLLSNGSVVDSEKTLESQSMFESKTSYKGTTLSCEVGIKQEEVVMTYSSLDKDAISRFEAAMTAAIYGANTTYYSERDAAYLKRDSGETKLWKEMLDKALLKREDTKVQAGVDYFENLDKAGISLVVAADKSAPTPSPTPTPTPTKSPEVSVTGNVQPVEMKLIGSIYFASGTYFLNDEAKKTIKALATSIFLKAPTQVLSYGFTDSKGGADNTVLSQNRAKAVAKFLRSFLPGQKIATGWYASSKPVATGTSKAALAKNRRVEIYIK